MIFQNKVIYIFSPQAWGYNHLSKHHYAIELSRLNNSVYFINPPETNYFPRKPSIHIINKNLAIVDYSILKGRNYFPIFLRSKQDYDSSRKIIKAIGGKPDIVINFDASVFHNLSVFNPGAKKIFFLVDLLPSRFHLEISKNVGLVLCASSTIQSYLAKLEISSVNIGHGLASHFVKSTNVEEVVKKKTIVGYVGNLNMEFIDYNNLIRAIKGNDELEFHFIGPNGVSNIGGGPERKELNEIHKLKNTYFHGELSSELLPEKITQMDMFLICYDTKRFANEVANSHKILEYLSTGKTVICNYTIDYLERTDLVEMVSDNLDLPSRIREVAGNLEIHNSPDKMTKRKKFAISNSYINKIHKIEELISELD